MLNSRPSQRQFLANICIPPTTFVHSFDTGFGRARQAAERRFVPCAPPRISYLAGKQRRFTLAHMSSYTLKISESRSFAGCTKIGRATLNNVQTNKFDFDPGRF